LANTGSNVPSPRLCRTFELPQSPVTSRSSHPSRSTSAKLPVNVHQSTTLSPSSVVKAERPAGPLASVKRPVPSFSQRCPVRSVSWARSFQ